MANYQFSGLNLRSLKTPAFIVDKALLENNLSVLADLRARAGCSILLALKGFAMFSLFPEVQKYLDGVCASGPYEARLGAEKFKKEVHVFAPAFTDQDIEEITPIANHLVFNSFRQWNIYKNKIPKNIKCGLRINPDFSEVEVDLYNPCAPGSRLGIKADAFVGQDLNGISGLHFHALCEQNADALENVLKVVEDKFDSLLSKMEWVNFGGGHHITRADYDIEKLIKLITKFKERYGVEVYLEPGEAVALDTGVLIASVLDIVDSEVPVAILDTSAEAHMPDVLAMPYRPEVIGAGKRGELKHTYRLGGLTCLAGDIIGDYSFNEELKPGDKLIFCDMAHYSMVKTTMFNGIKHPSINIYDSRTNKFQLVREFSFDDYKNRLS